MDNRSTSQLTDNAAKSYAAGLWMHEPVEALATVLGIVQGECDKAERRIPKKAVSAYEDDLRNSIYSIWWDLKCQLLGELERRAGGQS